VTSDLWFALLRTDGGSDYKCDRPDEVGMGEQKVMVSRWRMIFASSERNHIVEVQPRENVCNITHGEMDEKRV